MDAHSVWAKRKSQNLAINIAHKKPPLSGGFLFCLLLLYNKLDKGMKIT